MTNLVWCPSIDEEMRGQMANIVKHFRDMHNTPLEGGKKQLRNFAPPNYKLYVLAHGHGEMPLFKCNNKTWTATQLVQLLQSDGLSTAWRDIELLVCHAGESVNSVAVGNQLLEVFSKSKKFEKVPVFGAIKMSNGRKEYAKIAKNGKKPSLFTDSDQLLPLAAQFTHALKHAGYTNFRVISYAAPVAQNFTQGVTLDMKSKGGNWGETLDQNTGLIKIWQ